MSAVYDLKSTFRKMNMSDDYIRKREELPYQVNQNVQQVILDES